MIEQPDSVELDQVHGEVKFSGVSFRYEDSTQFVLNGVDLRIKAGEIVALVGPSGGGKTTVAKLLLRLYDPVCGKLCCHFNICFHIFNWPLILVYDHYTHLSSCVEELTYFLLTGVILMDGHDIRNIRLENLRRHVGLVSQDVVSSKILI